MSAAISSEHHHRYSESAEVPFAHVDYLGQGAHGIVDIVRRNTPHSESEHYARKVVMLSQPPKQGEIPAILREVSIGTRLRHDHIVRIIETYETPKAYAIIMTPVAQGNLETYFSALGKDEDYRHRERMSGWFGCLVNALEYLHREGIHHRDIKPRNILTMGENVFFTDFGISSEFQEKTLSGHTETLGTRTYRAPEHDSGHRPGRRADIFSLGAVFLEMITVFSDPGQLNKLQSHKPYSGELDDVQSWMDDLDRKPLDVAWYPTIVFLCRRMLQKEKNNRPYADDLAACWGYQPFSATPPTTCSCATTVSTYGAQGMSDALQKASINGHRLALELMTRGNVSVDRKHDLDTALLAACATGDITKVSLLLGEGADPVAKDTSGETALHRAAEKGHRSVAQLLLREGVDVAVENESGRKPLHWAARSGDKMMVELLLEEGADVNTVGRSGGTALHWAAENGHKTVVELLLEKRADVSAENKYGKTALHWAAEKGHEVVVQLLLEKAANPAAKDTSGETALHRAAEKGHRSVAQLLLREGVDVDVENELGRKPLHWAARSGDKMMIELLLEEGANVNTVDKFGGTALHWAAKNGHKTVVELLLEKRAYVSAENKDGKTALDWAEEKGHEAVVRILSGRMRLAALNST